MSRAIQAYLRVAAGAGRLVERDGPFWLFLDASQSQAFLNYAIPDDDAEPTAADVETLVTAARGHGRIPRLEFLTSTAPRAEAALRDAGFREEGRYPLMTLGHADFTPVAPGPGITLEEVTPHTPRQVLAAFSRVRNAAFGEPVRDGDTDRQADRLESQIGVLARVDGEPAGGGVCLVVSDATTELTGLGVAAAFRRRGVGAAVTSELARRAFAAGVRTAFLTPGEPSTARVYARSGFAGTEEMLHLRLDA